MTKKLNDVCVRGVATTQNEWHVNITKHCEEGAESKSALLVPRKRVLMSIAAATAALNCR
jgi:hypothetical protein